MKPILFCAFVLATPSSLQAQSFCGPVTADNLVSPTVLGNGTPGSVTTAQIQTALNAGGPILFNVGPSPTTIVLTATLTVNRAVVLDGAGVVTLSGGGARRIIQISPEPMIGYSITLQNISFSNGSALAGRGGAIFNVSGGFWQTVSLKLVNCVFSGNAAMPVGQDDGGGALYATGLNNVQVGNSSFTSNSGSNGGALYSLGSRTVTIVDSVFTGNQATGNGGNPGNGGNAGALGIDGADRLVDVCRTRFVNNSSNAYGAGFFSVMYDNTSRSRFEDVTFDSNQQTSSAQFAAGAYVQGGPFAFERTSFVNNNANGYTGLFVGPGASGTIRNGTFVGNVARQGLGAAIAIDQSAPVSIVSTTIANNVAAGALSFAGGISIGPSNQLRLTNVILANNTGGNRFVNWNIQNAASQDGGGNMQWPATRPMGGGAETPATPTTVFQDPLLAAAAAANGGQVPTIALTVPSPAINTGVSTAEVPATDARGQVRVGAPDRGSFEFVVPQISIGDATVLEGGPGTVLAFPVTLTPASTQTVTVQFATANNTAVAPSDYVATSGTLTFNPGQTSQTVSVTVNGDIAVEPNETFFVNLTSPTGATIADAQGLGTILNDDPNADLSITNTDGVATATPGQVLTYTITVANAGPNDAPGTTVADALPSGLTAATWSCAPAGGAMCGNLAGSGSISETVNLPVGGSVVYALIATVMPFPATVRNTATVTAPAGFGEPNPANNSATDDDLLVCSPSTVVVPDGRLTADSLGNGATAWYVASLHIGSSYSAEFTNRAGAAGAPTLTVFRGDDGCTLTSSAAARDTTIIDPPSGASGRQSFTASGADARYRLRIDNGTGSPLSYTLQVAETSLFSPAWSTNGPFDTFYSLQNTTGATVTGTLTLRDVTGAAISTSPVTVLAGRTTSANTLGLAVTRNRTGTAQFSHDGPPGAVVVESAIANFTLTTPYVQPVKFVAPREQR